MKNIVDNKKLSKGALSYTKIAKNLGRYMLTIGKKLILYKINKGKMKTNIEFVKSITNTGTRTNLHS